MAERKWLFLAAGLVLVAVSGFAIWKLHGTALVRPTAAFKSIGLSELSTTGFSLYVDVTVTNPNPVPLPIDHVDYSMSISGVRVVEGARIKPSGWIAASGTSVVRIPVPLTYQQVYGTEEAVRGGDGNVKVQISGLIDLNGGIPLAEAPGLPFSYEGTISLAGVRDKALAVVKNNATAKNWLSKARNWISKQ